MEGWKMGLRQYSKEWLEELCKDSFSYAEVLRKAGRKQGGGAQKTLREKIQLYNIDISHFTGQRWNKGQTKDSDDRIKQQSLNQEKYSLDEILIENSPVTQKVLRDYVKRHSLLEYKCHNCGCTGQWQNGQIALQIHHINGNNKDNRLMNLQYLCPNCHALTETYCGKNKKS